MLQLKELFAKWCGEAPSAVERLAGAGSNRAYYRLSAPGVPSVIGCVGTSREENGAFVYLARHFAARNLPVPEIFAVSDDGMRYLQSNLGGRSLFDALRSGREAGGQYSEEERRLLCATISVLPKMQFEGGEGLDYDKCYPLSDFDKESVFFDLNYFKYCFLKTSCIDFNEKRLEIDFQEFATELLMEDKSLPHDTFLYRDFQARNVMLDASDAPFLIDFQGGRRGPIYYDVASFLWQASARYDDGLREELIREYLAAASRYAPALRYETFRKRLDLFVLFRTLQVLGAYGFRGNFERKRHFIESIPPALDNLRNILTAVNAGERYPYLNALCSELTERKATQKTADCNHSDAETPTAAAAPKEPLVVRITSFSYRKGIPKDTSGNGGGYVFDCRAIHNPGRYDEYKRLTGLDAPVISFLEDDGEVLYFMERVYDLADRHIERYIERGFTSLMFSFGCTGGQHRSVYCAQHLAEHIRNRYGSVEVLLEHREQGVKG